MQQELNGNRLTNAKHESFCQQVANGMQPKEACIAAGYKSNGARVASRLLKNSAVRKRLFQLQQEAAGSASQIEILNLNRVLDRLSVLSYQAQQKGQYATAVKCEELIGRHVGLFDEWDGDPATLPDWQLEKWLKYFDEMLKKDEAAEKFDSTVARNAG